MDQRITRRTFVRSIAYAGVLAPLVAPRLVRAASANSKVNHAAFGADGQAWYDLNNFVRSKYFNLVAICDVDLGRAAKAKKKWPDAPVYQDFRQVLDKHGKELDSVNVTVPDNMHATIAMAAIHLGKAVYCQKPLCHDIYEIRKLTEAARKAGVVTQMGIQIHSYTQYRLAVKLVQNGAIGKVHRVHAWSDKNWGGNVHGGVRPQHTDPVPTDFDWNLWLGVAPERPFVKGIYHPGQWRRWLDFGTGTFGDMGCHIYDPVFSALALTAPTTVTSRGPQPYPECWPNWATVDYQFPATAYTASEGVHVTWYDGSNAVSRVPNPDKIKLPGQGSLMIGEKGSMLLPHISTPQLLPHEKFEHYDYPHFPATDHYMQFLDAVRGEDKTSAGFDYAGPLSESVLLGGVAVRFPNQALHWDAANLKFTGNDDATAHLRREYRKGWAVPGLG